MTYGIKVGQKYVPADGSPGVLTVLDINPDRTWHDILVFDDRLNKERLIDSFKLAKVRYMLQEEVNDE